MRACARPTCWWISDEEAWQQLQIEGAAIEEYSLLYSVLTPAHKLGWN
jgi:hypothetical protein